MKYVFRWSFGELLVPDENNPLRLVRSLLVVVVADKNEFGVFGVDVEGGYAAVARPALVLEYAILAQ